MIIIIIISYFDRISHLKKNIIKRYFRKIFYFLLLYVFSMNNRKLF